MDLFCLSNVKTLKFLEDMSNGGADAEAGNAKILYNVQQNVGNFRTLKKRIALFQQNHVSIE